MPKHNMPSTNANTCQNITRTLTEDVAIRTLRNTFRRDGQTDRTQQVGAVWRGGHTSVYKDEKIPWALA